MNTETNVAQAKALFSELRIECAWKHPGCLGVLQQGVPGGPVSHAMCVNCLAVEREALRNWRLLQRRLS